MADKVRLITIDDHDAMDDTANAAKVIVVDDSGDALATAEGQLRVIAKPYGWAIAEEEVTGHTAVKVMVRDTVEGRSQGLSGVEKLKEDEGMLFVFPVLSKYSFWMKGMKFDLDFVWIKDNKVVEITEGVKASREGEAVVRVQPEMGVNRVLEVKSGFVKENEIKVGDMTQLGL